MPKRRLDINAILAPHFRGSAGDAATYEARPAQQEMAEAVMHTLGTGGSILIDAPTGIGKSFAYLIPLIEHALGDDVRCVVSTYTKALQRQLIKKDLPFLKAHVYPTLRYSLVLGSENYLCLRRLEQAGTLGLFQGEDDEVAALIRWAEETETGIREWQSQELWRTVGREGDLCGFRNCRHYNDCFYFRARAEQRRSHLLVINHHLYFAHLSTGMSLLPSFQAAVFDEAHELEDVAASYLGLETSNMRMRHLLGSILSAKGTGILARARGIAPSDFAHASGILNAVRSASEVFFRNVTLRMRQRTERIREPGFVDDTLSEPLMRLYRELDGLVAGTKDEDMRLELQGIARRCEAQALALERILTMGLEDHVYWAEASGSVVRLLAAPVDVASMRVFESLDAAIFTSATMSVGGGGFSYIRERLGISEAAELALGSHFDFRNQARLYVARDLPPPGAEGYEEAVIRRTGEILRLMRGRTLVLFTSHSMLTATYEALGPEFEGITLARQGDAESYELVDRFRRGEIGAIFGTYTFWQGIDVPGEALSCVVITKLPFAAPDEPLVQARMEALERAGRDPFSEYQVPRASVLFKQGFGRLIRRATDIGTVAVLDSRLVTKGYGKRFLKTLPDVPITSDLNDLHL